MYVCMHALSWNLLGTRGVKLFLDGVHEEGYGAMTMLFVLRFV